MLTSLPVILPRVRIADVRGAKISVTLLGRSLRTAEEAKACMDDVVIALALFNVLSAINA